MQEDHHLRALHRHVRTIEAFAAWLRDRSDDLIDAVDLLGGAHWVTRTADTVHAIRKGATLESRLADLKEIRRFLHLEYAGRPGSEEQARFAAVHPDDPRADTARLCAEALDRGIAGIEAIERAAAVQAREVA
ncbi:MAG: hypothetical protein H6901_00670 [Rhodobacteraceae bacterium]|nr:hypothetical protein [Paracoccaceae bacterium]MCP5340717.1 hypothetical protein [Paracoccaceae bacterium]